ncbi:hypothetical protein D5366_08750 [Neokomagataea tanensis]|uniref:Sodium:solute symporter family protein n=1 Tax=Neokomagataea tanensis TaxID=661191 RepID=A0A4Y6V9E7_9PROT|nr:MULTISPECIES: hypothetical protein [Neokomagataea]QDH25280.1 hypothetical protein D5366_08750 [Neokomagataea tanensis]
MIISFVLVLLLALFLSLLARRGHHASDPRAFFAARGQFGALLFFLLSVGETYSIGTVLGFPGGIAASGSVDIILWFTGYILLAFPVCFVVFPKLWSAGQRTGAITLPDLFGRHFESKHLEKFIGILLAFLMLPMGTMQFMGLETVLSSLHLPLSGNFLSFSSAILAFVFTAIAGLRGTALISILKDFLVLSAIIIVAASALWSWQHEVPSIEEGHLILQHGSDHSTQSLLMILSTIIIQALGFSVVPQTAVATFSARDPNSIRRAQVWMPLYLVLFPCLVLIAMFGMSHKIQTARPDQLFLEVAHHLLPNWLCGLIYSAAALTALVWLGSVCLALAAIVTRNVLPNISSQHQKKVGLFVIACYIFLSELASHLNNFPISKINNIFYFGLIQIFPSFILCIAERKINWMFIVLSICAGMLTSIYIMVNNFNLYGLNISVIGITVNIIILSMNLIYRKIKPALSTK